MGTGRTDEFRKDSVRIALTSGLSRQQVADDLGVGKSTLNKWVTAHRDTDVVSSEDRKLARASERLRRENIGAPFGFWRGCSTGCCPVRLKLHSGYRSRTEWPPLVLF
jgi:transposase